MDDFGQPQPFWRHRQKDASKLCAVRDARLFLELAGVKP
jgi:hypothetical protein